MSKFIPKLLVVMVLFGSFLTFLAPKSASAALYSQAAYPYAQASYCAQLYRHEPSSLAFISEDSLLGVLFDWLNIVPEAKANLDPCPDPYTQASYGYAQSSYTCTPYPECTVYGYGQSSYYTYLQANYYSYGQANYYSYLQSTYAYIQSSYYSYGQANYYSYGQANYYSYGQSSYYAYNQSNYYAQSTYAYAQTSYNTGSSGTCSPPAGGTLTITSSCAFARVGSAQGGFYYNGVDAGDLIIANGSQLTVNADQIIVYNSGNKLETQGSGSIILVDGGKIIKGNLYMRDSDGDGYPTDLTQYITAGDVSYKRRSTMWRSNASSTDCNDSVSSANPGGC